LSLSDQSFLDDTLTGITGIFNQQQDDSTEQQVSIDETIYREYSNRDLEFTITIPRSWLVEEYDQQAEIFSDTGNSGVNIEAQFDPALTDTSLNQEVCVYIGEGFRAGLGLTSDSQEFLFNYTTLNEIPACNARGSVKDGVTQNYYFLFNDQNLKTYTVLYTTREPAEEEQLKKVVGSFRFSE
jgi:hypothetical protein